jgi:hypothetical protein
MKEIAELRAELAALRHCLTLGACIGCFIAGCAVGYWAA